MTTLQERVDHLRTMQQQRIAAQKILDEQQERERTLMEEIRIEMIDGGIVEVDGAVGAVVLNTRETPEADDWEQIKRYIMDTGNFQLIQKRLSVTGVREIWEVGDDIPGIARVRELYLTLKGVKK